jgi:hypothetical protein
MVKMNFWKHPRILLFTILFATALGSCTSGQGSVLPLTSFTENDVEVTLSLKQDANGNSVLSATFLPPKGYHLYSKDIPISGVDGLGRPTLLELTAESLMQATGILGESVKPEKPDFEPKELLVYPAGAITLSLPVKLPPGEDWVEDDLSITYMACSASACKPPVVGKIISVRIPEAGVLDRK